MSSSNNSAVKIDATPATAGEKADQVDTTCVVCFKICDIFSIGECDHPVCYECSTRKSIRIYTPTGT